MVTGMRFRNAANVCTIPENNNARGSSPDIYTAASPGPAARPRCVYPAISGAVRDDRNCKIIKTMRGMGFEPKNPCGTSP